MQLPTTRQLQYLVATAETGHFGRAAERCFVSQSALSTGIRELESQLGIKLLDRNRKKITATPIGEKVIEQSRTCLTELAKLTELANTSTRPLSGPLRMGIIPTIAPFLLPLLLPSLRTQFPSMEFYLTENLTDNLCLQLEQGKLDILILAQPYDTGPIKITPLYSDTLHLAYQKNTKLFDPNNWSLPNLINESLMLLEDGHCLRDQVLHQLPGVSDSAINPFSASSLSTLIHMIQSDLCYSIFPSIARGSALLKNAGISLQPLNNAAHREIVLAWRSGSLRDDDYSNIARFINQHLQKISRYN